MRVLAAMSGGVDSSVAAALAVAAGHEVVGVHLALAPAAARRAGPSGPAAGARGCCTVEDARDARRVADVLDIPCYVWDLAEQFADDVVDDFVAEYAAGRTPNPCVRCNEKVKFAALLDRAVALGFDALVTGHYARVLPGPDGPQLHRAADAAKDQSYVLAGIGRQALHRVLLPVGEVTSKAQVRQEADRLGLSTAAKPDSHDICFIPDGDTRRWLDARVPRRPGAVLDETGAQVGEHDGAAGYTVGQRRGLRLGRPAADGRPRYVLSLSVVSNTVTVGPAEQLEVSRLGALRPRWLTTPPAVGDDVLAQVRAHGEPVPGRVAGLTADHVEVALDRPLVAVAGGQTLALYDGDRVLGAAVLQDAA